MIKRLSFIGSVVVSCLAGFSAFAADLSDEQIDQEISRMEKQAAVARKTEKATPVAIAPEALPAKIDIDKVFSADTSKLTSSETPLTIDPANEAIAVAAVTAEESKTPVFSDTKKVEKEKGEDTLSRLSLSLGVLALIGLGSVFFIRRYSQGRREKLKHTQIKVLTQHHLGPKKTLTIVRVAGESLLLGVTDQSITLIKNLSLIDDEFPEELPTQFKHEIDYKTNLLAPTHAEVEHEVISSEEPVEEFQMGSMIPRSAPQRGGRRWLT